MAEINWGALQTPDFMGNALKAQALGQQNHAQTVKDNALKQYGTDPEGAIASLMAVDPEAALQLRKARREEESYKNRQAAGKKLAGGDSAGAQSDAVAAGDFDMASAIANMSKEQRAEAKERAGTFASLLFPLQEVPYEARKAQIANYTPEQLSAAGLTPAQAQAFDPTDANIKAQIGTALTIKDRLDQHDKDRTFDETHRHNQVGERNDTERVGISRGQLGVSQGQLGVAQAGLGIRQAELGLSRDRLAFDQAGGKQKPVPAQVASGHAANNTSMAQIDRAIAAIDAHPKALGLTRQLGDGVNQRVDPKGIDARALLSDIGSLKLHDRSGAAVSISEAPRLMPFIPRVTDTPEAAKKKLSQLREQLQNSNAEIEVQFGPDNGYHPLTAGSSGDKVITYDAKGNRK